MTSTTTDNTAAANEEGEKFCSSCFRYRPAKEVHLVTSSNGKQKLLRCDHCNKAREEAAAARMAALKKTKKKVKAKPAA